MLCGVAFAFSIDTRAAVCESVFYLKFGLFVYFVAFSNTHTILPLFSSYQRTGMILWAFLPAFVWMFSSRFFTRLWTQSKFHILVSLFVRKEWDFMRFYFVFVGFYWGEYLHDKKVRTVLIFMLEKTHAYNSLLIKRWWWRRNISLLRCVHMSLCVCVSVRVVKRYDAGMCRYISSCNIHCINIAVDTATIYHRNKEIKKVIQLKPTQCVAQSTHTSYQIFHLFWPSNSFEKFAVVPLWAWNSI